MSRQAFTIGTVVRTNVDLMGNPKGSLGLCYDTYSGSSGFIFENGAYDSFSDEDQIMLDYVGKSEKYSNYEFTSVAQLSQDYKDGKFDFASLRAEFGIGG